MNQSRPKNLNLFTIRFPLPAIVSILHRISGVILFLLIPLLLWGLACSLTESGFEAWQTALSVPWIKVLLWLLLVPYCFHLVAGIRHLLMDIHIGTSLRGGKFSALSVFIISILFILLVGGWLW